MQLQPSPPTWIDQAPNRFRIEETLTSPINDVWAVLADNNAWADWVPSFRSCSWVGTTETGRVGAVRHVHQPPFHVTETITGWDAPHFWAMQVDEINIGLIRRMAETVTLSPEGSDGTNLRWEVGVELAPLVRPLWAILRRDNERKLRKAIQGLDRVAAARKVRS